MTPPKATDEGVSGRRPNGDRGAAAPIQRAAVRVGAGTDARSVARTFLGPRAERLRTGEKRRKNLETYLFVNGNGDVRVETGDYPTASVNLATDPPRVQIPSTKYEQRVTEYDRERFDQIVQYAFADHERGHILYTPFEYYCGKLTERPKRQQGAYKSVQNALEDGAIEEQLRADDGTSVGVRLSTLHATLGARTLARAADSGGMSYSFLRAVQSYILDIGRYDTGITRILMDEGDDRFAFADDAARARFCDWRDRIESAVADVITTRDPRDRTDRIFEFADALIDAADDADDASPPSEGARGMSGDDGRGTDGADGSLAADPDDRDGNGDTDPSRGREPEPTEHDTDEDDIRSRARSVLGDGSDDGDDVSDGDDEGDGAEGDAAPSDDSDDETDAVGDEGDEGDESNAMGDEGDESNAMGDEGDESDGRDGGDDAMGDDAMGDAEDDGAGADPNAPPSIDDGAEDRKDATEDIDDARQDESRAEDDREATFEDAVRKLSDTVGGDSSGGGRSGGGSGSSASGSSGLESAVDLAVPSSAFDRERWERAVADSTRLGRLFEKQLRAEGGEQRLRGLKRGQIDTSRLFTLRTGSKDCMQRRIPAEDPEFSAVFLTDRSTSMSREDIETAERATLGIALAFERIGIDVCLMDMLENTARIVSPFETPIEDARRAAVTGETGGGTPLAQALSTVADRVRWKPGQTFAVVVTDGQPNDPGAYADALEDIGHFAHVFGVEIDLDGDDRRPQYDRNYHRGTSVSDADELVDDVDRMVSGAAF